MDANYKHNRMSKDDAAVSLVPAFSPDEFRNNVLALADVRGI